MPNKLFFFVCWLFVIPLFSHDMRLLYQTNHPAPNNPYEEKLIEHVKTSVEKALRLDSKLNTGLFNDVEEALQWRKSTIPHYHVLQDLPKIPLYHLLNNLCTLQGASHLQVGLLAGDSFIAALYRNQDILKQKIGVEWFKECPELVFYLNCCEYLDLNDYQIIKSDCFKVEKSNFDDPIDIYFYDADHSLIGHEKTFTYYNDIFAGTFITVIDDWECPWIRAPTFKAFAKLGYTVLYEATLPKLEAENGHYVAVIRKPSRDFSPTELYYPKHAQESEFQNLKKRVHEYLQNTWWYKEEKIDLIMDHLFQTRPKICVEIGVGAGASFLPIAATLQYLGQGHAYAIDPWSNEEAKKGLEQKHVYWPWWISVDIQGLSWEFITTIKAWSLESICTTFTLPSKEAIDQFETIDFLHLDGNISEEGALLEAKIYVPKVASGGYILLSNLFEVVDKQCPKMKTLWYLLDHCEVVTQIEPNGNTVLFRKL